jgi:hypothetical protein
MLFACFSSSARPLPTSPPWKCAQSVAKGMWTDVRIGAAQLPSPEAVERFAHP